MLYTGKMMNLGLLHYQLNSECTYYYHKIKIDNHLNCVFINTKTKEISFCARQNAREIFIQELRKLGVQE